MGNGRMRYGGRHNSIMKDNINPSHYKNGEVEAIEAIEALTQNDMGIKCVQKANLIKYLWRYESKNGLEDVKKAKWYFNHVPKSKKGKQLPTEKQIIESAIVNKPSPESLLVSIIIKQLSRPSDHDGDQLINIYLNQLETILTEKNTNENIRKNSKPNTSDVGVSSESSENQEGCEESILQEQLRNPVEHLGQRDASSDRGWNRSHTGPNGRGINYTIDS